MPNNLNVVLVHGAWGDGSHSPHVIPAPRQGLPGHRGAESADLIARRYPTAPASSWRRRTARRYWSAIPTDGMVITGAGHAPNVIGLVYVAAFAPDEGESPDGLFALREPPPGAANIRPGKDGFLDRSGQIPRKLLPGP